MPTPDPYFFDEAEYLRLNPDVAQAVASGAVASGLEHWRQVGRMERRAYREQPPVSVQEFEESAYLLEHADVRAAVLAGVLESGYEHWKDAGYREQRAFRTGGLWYGRIADPVSEPSEHAYLMLNPAVADAVRGGTYQSGHDHWTQVGRNEGRLYYDEQPVRKVTAAEALEGRTRGVNYFGFQSQPTGLGSAARGYLEVLRQLGIACEAVDVTPWHETRPNAAETGRARFGVNFIHQNADMMPLFLSEFGLDLLSTRYNIGLWVWEMHAGYPEWAGHASLLHEIWAPSSFVARAIQTISPVPVRCVPYVVEPLPVDANVTREDLGIPADAFTFLYVFDISSAVERKNPFGLIRAFRMAFGDSPDVCLVLKYTGCDTSPQVDFMLRRMQTEYGNVRTLSGVMEQDKIGSLFELADCFVSPHRAEGFGLNIAAAMAMGKPVICTAWSGNTDYTDESNSFPVRYRLSMLSQTLEPYRQNYAWAEPCLSHLAERMQQVRSNPTEARMRGEAARQHMLRNYSVAAIGRIVTDRLGEAGLGAFCVE